ncbi:retrovirus-related pol polyprotein from transposon TNT 1-94 [Tanacetum coccineum]
MSNTNNNLQTHTSNALHNAIMEVGGKDRPSMLAPGYMENYKNVSQDIKNQLDVEVEAVQVILTRIDTDIYSTVDACPNACEMWKAIKRLKQESQRFMTLVKQSQELKTVSYHKLYDILKQHQNKVNEIRAERLALTANPLALRSVNVAGARENVDVADNSGPIFNAEPLQKLIEIILFIVDSGCSKHMMGNLKLLSNFVENFLGTVKFGNDQIALILGYGDLGNDLLTDSRGTDLYSITLQDTSTPNPICLMAKASSSHAWLWHRHLSHLNFDTINLLSKYNIMTGLPKLNFVKDYLCSSCELGKAELHMVAASKVLILKPGEYELWRMRMEQYIQMIDYSLWEVIKNGNAPPIKKVVEGVETIIAPTTAEEKAQRRSEVLDQTFDRLQKLISQLEIHGESISQEDVNQKFLRCLSPEWNTHTIVWRNKAEIDTLSLDDLYHNLKNYEPDVKGTSSSSTNT